MSNKSSRNNIDHTIIQHSESDDLVELSSHGNYFQIKLLLSNGYNVINNNGNSALITSTIKRDSCIIKLLLEHGADIDYKDNFENTALIIATKYNYNDIVELLLQYKPNINLTNDIGNNAIMEAILNKNEYICKLLFNNGGNIYQPNERGTTPFIQACIQSCIDGNINIPKFLLENNINVNVRDKHGNNALMSIMEFPIRYYNIITLLLNYDIDIYAVNNDNDTVLTLASMYKQEIFVDMLLIDYF